MSSLRGYTQDYASTMQRSDDGVVGVNSDSFGASPIKDVSSAALTGPLIWSGQDFQGDQAYTLRLSHEEASEVDSALAGFKGQFQWTLNHSTSQVELTNGE